MKCMEIIQKLEILAPPELALEWDNSGLITGSMKQDIKKIYIALDATDEVIERAVLCHADMLLTHHPLIFSPIKHVNDTDLTGRRLMKLIGSRIACYAMHTNYDCAQYGMAYAAAKRMGFSVSEPLEVTYSDGKMTCGIGCISVPENQYTVSTLCEKIKSVFELPSVTVYGKQYLDRPVTKVALCPGSGKSEISQALLKGADVLITGDIGHHEGIDASAMHMTVIDAGHYGIEHIFMNELSEYLKDVNGIETVSDPVDIPSVVL